MAGQHDSRDSQFGGVRSNALCVGVARWGERTLMTLRGELDVATALEFEWALTEQAYAGGVVVVDLRELSFIDATGLAVLIRAQAAAPRSGLRLEVMPGDRVRRLLVLCGVATYFAYAKPPAE